MFKRPDYIAISIVCFLFAILVVIQVKSAKNYRNITQPETNAVLALEVARLTESNANLRTEVKSLTESLDKYKTSSANRQTAFAQYQNDSNRYDLINGATGTKGQGIIINVNGTLNLPEVVDLVNAIKNVGGELIAINDSRLVLNTSLYPYVNQSSLQFKVLGNSNLLQSSLQRKGGIIEQISSKDIKFNINKENELTIPPVKNGMQFKYARPINN